MYVIIYSNDHQLHEYLELNCNECIPYDILQQWLPDHKTKLATWIFKLAINIVHVFFVISIGKW